MREVTGADTRGELVDRSHAVRVTVSTTRRFLSPFVAALGATYLGFTALYSAGIPNRGYRSLAILTAISVVIVAACAAAARWRTLSGRGVQLVSAVVGLVVISNVATEYVVSGELAHTVAFVLTLIAAGVLAPTPSQFYGFAISSIVAWALGTYVGDVLGDHVQAIIGLLTGTVIAAMIFEARLRSTARVEGLRLSVERARDRELREFFAASADTVLLHDGERITYANPALGALLGYSPPDLVGRTLESLMSSRSADRLAGLLTSDKPASLTLELVRRDQETVLVEIAAPRTIQLDGKPTTIWIGRDVTEVQQELEARQLAADGAEIASMLAAGLSHELNNPLSVLTLSLAALDRSNPVVADIDASLARITAIVRDLETIKPIGRAPIESVDIVDVVQQLAEVATNELGCAAVIALDLAPAPAVQVARSELMQALLDLLIATLRAAEGPRTFTLRTLVDPDGHAVIEVGTDLVVPAGSRPLEPSFFARTTRLGTNLSLYHCHAVVAAAGATITSTNSATGVVFRIAFPLEGKPDPSRRLRVLVVDDEPAVGRAIVRLLDECEVKFVTSGTEAIGQYAADQPDLVLCDIMMPGLSGPAFYERLLEREPAARERVVFMTGGAFTPKTRSFVETTKNRVLKKPIEVATLRELVRETATRGARSRPS